LEVDVLRANGQAINEACGGLGRLGLDNFAAMAYLVENQRTEHHPMAMTAQDIERHIKEGLPGCLVEIKDLAGDGNHYAATVVSAAFKGKSRVQQHQMVYAALKGNMGGVLHALALTTSSPKDE
jgi:stress-induced morphogen